MVQALLQQNRDFRLLLTGSTLAGLGSMIGNLALPLLVLAETGSPTSAGLVGSVSAVTMVLAGIPAGAVADAVERRRLMIVAQVVGAVVALVLAGAVLTGTAGMPLILAVTVIVSMMAVLYSPAAMGMVQATVPGDDLGRATSHLQARNAALQIAGPLAGGIVFSLAPALPFAVRALALLLSVACLLAMRTRSAPAVAPRLTSLSELTAGLRFVWRQRYLRTILTLFGAGVGTVFSAVMLIALAASAASDPTGRSSGVMVALGAAGSLAGALLAPHLPGRRRVARVLILATVVAAAAAPMMALAAARPLLIGGVLAAVMLVAAISTVAFETEMVRLTPPELMGRSEAGQIVISTITAPLGPLGGGLLAEILGAPKAFLITGAAFAVLAAALAFSLRGSRQ